MAALPLNPLLPGRTLPDYLPARMVNEFVYCPRLFFYEFVEGVFRESSDTIEGRAQHKRVDKPSKGMPQPDDAAQEETSLQVRALTLSSERLRVIAKLDLAELDSGEITPVDYKHGKPYIENDELKLWPSDCVKLALQGLILRENGYSSNEGIIFYQQTRQRVRVEFTDKLMAEAELAVARAWEVARFEPMPPPLFGSPKCPGCSLAPICLPDEVIRLHDAPEAPGEQLPLFDLPPRKPAASEVRRLLAPRDDLRPLYLDTQGLRVGRSGGVLQAKERDKIVGEYRISDLCQVNLYGNIQISTQAVQALCEAEIPVCYFSPGGWFYGITNGLLTKNVFLRQRQFTLSSEDWFCRKLARTLVAGKIRNARVFYQRNHIEPRPRSLADLKSLAERAERTSSLEELLGVEGLAARIYFGELEGLIKRDADLDSASDAHMLFSFEARNRRPPRDPVNALLSLGYSMLAKDLTVACYAAGFDPMVGFYHQPRFGRPALALDLMEPFRPLIVDSAVINAINTHMISASDFMKSGPAVALTASGRKAFYRAYELRMDTLVTHPLFGYRVSYRRLLEIQARLLGKFLEGDIAEYPVFVVR